MSKHLEIGEKIELDMSSRRNFLKMLGGGAVGLLGLQTAIERAYGEKAEGVPLVHTHDIYGNPDTVRLVPEERYRKIMEYKNLPRRFTRQNGVRSVGLTQLSRDETDLVLEVTIDPAREDDLTRETLESQRPDGAMGVTVETGERRNLEFLSSSEQQDLESLSCSDRDDEYSELVGGIEVNNDVELTSGGTLGLVGYNTDAEPVIVTAHHITHASDEILQPDEGRVVGDLHEASPHRTEEDTVSYSIREDVVDYSAREVEDIQDIDGKWTFEGITDETSGWIGGSIDVDFSGKTSCTGSNTAVDTERGTDYVEHAVWMDASPEQDGDSGGPWIDDDGKLVALASAGSEDPDGASVGAAATEALEAVDAQLYPMCYAGADTTC